jgi:hypothetical protein
MAAEKSGHTLGKSPRSGDAGGSRPSRAAPIHISGGHHFRQSGDDAGGSKASRDMTARDIGISGGRQLGSHPPWGCMLGGGGERSGDAGGSKGA